MDNGEEFLKMWYKTGSPKYEIIIDGNRNIISYKEWNEEGEFVKNWSS